MVKLKIAPGVDVEPLRAVIAAVGAERVAADANGTYGGVDELGDIDTLGLVYLEQPVAPGATWDELAAVARALRTPVALDESLTSPDAVRDALRAGAAEVVSVKPARLGGVRAAATAVELALDAGVQAFVGGMLELGVGRAGSAAVAALPGCSLPTDLGPSDRYVAVDVTDPVVVDGDGRLVGARRSGLRAHPAARRARSLHGRRGAARHLTRRHARRVERRLGAGAPARLSGGRARSRCARGPG